MYAGYMNGVEAWREPDELRIRTVPFADNMWRVMRADPNLVKEHMIDDHAFRKSDGTVEWVPRKWQVVCTGCSKRSVIQIALQ